MMVVRDAISVFSSPFSGTFFNCYVTTQEYTEMYEEVFVPFLGDFFSMDDIAYIREKEEDCFRPLSRGLFFNSRADLREI